MRTTLIALLALALPTVLAAQEPAEFDADAPRVQIEQATDAPEAPAPALDRVDLDADRSADADSRTTTADEAAAMQEPGSRNFWYIVGAVVVGGIIVALLL